VEVVFDISLSVEVIIELWLWALSLLCEIDICLAKCLSF